jgi:hypothetical protein
MSMIPTSSRLPVSKRSDEDALGKVLKEIADLIGMDNVKDELNQLIALGQQGNESRLTRLWLQGAENVQQVLRVPGGALAAALD